MRIQWIYLLVALVLLLPAMPYSAAVRRSLGSSRRRSSVKPMAAAAVWQNWFDFIRALAGAYLLTAGIESDPEHSGSELGAALLEGAILSMGVFVQTIRMAHHIRILAPVFYMCGVTLVLGWWAPGGFAVGASWLFAWAAGSLAYQLPAMAVALLVGGLVLGDHSPLLLLLNCGLMLLPSLVALLLKKRLLVAAASVPG